MSRILAIDWGEKRVGLAISDPTHTIAQPFRTLSFRGWPSLAAELQLIVKQEQVERIVIGLPVTMKGTDSQKTQQVREGVAYLRSRLSVPVETWDERLTTIQAHRSLHQMGRQPSRERHRVDQLAATHLLQSYLDKQARKV